MNVCCNHRALHPAWAVTANVHGGPTAVRAVFAELTVRLTQSGLRSFVANSIVRAFDGRENAVRANKDSGKYSWGSITADEMEFLFLMLCPCLDGLLDVQLRVLNAASRGIVPQPPTVHDPMPGCLLACGKLLSWYSNTMTPNMTRQDIAQCSDEGAELMRHVQRMFPIRNMSVTKWVDSILAPPVSKAPRSARQKCASKWGMSKGHAIMSHANSSNLSMGDSANTCAQIIEMKHLDIKKGAARTNQRKGWELQVLLMEQRQDDVSTQSYAGAQQNEHSEHTEEAEFDVRKCMPRGRATFSHTMHSTALKYPVYTAICEHLQCSRHLGVRAKVSDNQEHEFNITTNTLSGAHSAYSQDCPDLKHLPMALARFVCEKYHHLDTQKFPGRHVDLEHQEIHTLNLLAGRLIGGQGSVRRQGCQPIKRPKKTVKEHGVLAVYNTVVIEHPAIHGEVNLFELPRYTEIVS